MATSANSVRLPAQSREEIAYGFIIDLLFNFHKVYAVLDEVFLAGEIQETSKSVVLGRLEQLESLP